MFLYQPFTLYIFLHCRSSAMGANLQRIAQYFGEIVEIAEFINQYRCEINLVIAYIEELRNITTESDELEQIRREFVEELAKAKILSDSLTVPGISLLMPT